MSLQYGAQLSLLKNGCILVILCFYKETRLWSTYVIWQLFEEEFLNFPFKTVRSRLLMQIDNVNFSACRKEQI